MAQILLTADGMALLPVVTAIIVGARLTGRVRSEPKPGEGHVIVVGGGEVGIRVLGGLFDLGFHAVLIDQDQNARAVEFARGHRLPVMVGDACDEKTLRQAGIETALALVCVTSSDIVNLETTLQARAMRDETHAHRAPALRRRPCRAGAPEGPQRRLPVRLLPGRARVRRGAARAPGAADDRGRPGTCC